MRQREGGVSKGRLLLLIEPYENAAASAIIIFVYGGGMSREWATEPVAVPDAVGPLPWSLGVVLRPARWGACSRCVRLPHLRPVRVVWVPACRRHGCGLHGVRPSARGSPPIRRRPTAGDFLQTPSSAGFRQKESARVAGHAALPKERPSADSIRAIAAARGYGGAACGRVPAPLPKPSDCSSFESFVRP